jgi:hypothetical protein
MSEVESFGVTRFMSFTEPAPRHAKADPTDLRVSHRDGRSSNSFKRTGEIGESMAALGYIGGKLGVSQP